MGLLRKCFFGRYAIYNQTSAANTIKPPKDDCIIVGWTKKGIDMNTTNGREKAASNVAIATRDLGKELGFAVGSRCLAIKTRMMGKTTRGMNMPMPSSNNNRDTRIRIIGSQIAFNVTKRSSVNSFIRLSPISSLSA